MGQNLSTLKVRGIPHSQSEFQGEYCLKSLGLRKETFLNYYSILFSVLDKCILALFTACLECYCKDNFPIHHLEHITHLRSPPLATSSPLLRYKLLLFTFMALHNFSLFYWTSSDQHAGTAFHLRPAWAARFCSLPASFPNVFALSPILLLKTEILLLTLAARATHKSAKPQNPSQN